MMMMVKMTMEMMVMVAVMIMMMTMLMKMMMMMRMTMIMIMMMIRVDMLNTTWSAVLVSAGKPEVPEPAIPVAASMLRCSPCAGQAKATA